MGAGAAGIGLASGISLGASRPGQNAPSNDDQVLFIGDDTAIADTVYGKVQGLSLIHI